MELLETQDPEKKRLIEASDRHKHEIEKEVKELSDKTERIVKNALIIGGTLAVTYLLVSSLTSRRKKKKIKSKINRAVASESDDSEADVASASFAPPSILSQLGERFATQATAVLLGIAKDKLTEYLSNRKQKDENS
jgi:Icc-related predicted phosphoesterase